VARARPDGYTLLVGTNSTYAMAPFLLDNIPYDNDRAFAPVGLLATNAQYMCVHPSLPARSVAELIALARARPDGLSYSSSGAGSSAHLAVELFNVMADVRMLHVPYRGGAPAAQALITNEVQFSAIDAVTALPLMRAGSVRAIAVSSARRAALMPEVPTVAESGLPGFESSTDFSMFAPAGTPEDIIRRLHAANVAALRAPEVKERLDSLAIEAVGGTPGEFAAYQRREMEKWGRIIRERNIKAG
jgi:tripartite-type tricarboxylate transporter receptor subunit TctC